MIIENGYLSNQKDYGFCKPTKVTRLSEVSRSYVFPKYLVFNQYLSYIERYGSFSLALTCIDWSIIGLCKHYFLSSFDHMSLESI